MTSYILQVWGEDWGDRDRPHQHSDCHKRERSSGLRRLHLHRTQQHGRGLSRHPAPQHQYVQTGSEPFNAELERSASPDWSGHLLLTPIERWSWISINVWINKNVINENKQTSVSGCQISYHKLINVHKDDEQSHERDFVFLDPSSNCDINYSVVVISVRSFSGCSLIYRTIGLNDLCTSRSQCSSLCLFVILMILFMLHLCLILFMLHLCLHTSFRDAPKLLQKIPIPFLILNYYYYTYYYYCMYIYITNITYRYIDIDRYCIFYRNKHWKWICINKYENI